MTFGNLSSHQDRQVTALYDAPPPATVVEIIEELDKKLTDANERVTELEGKIEELESQLKTAKEASSE